MIWLWVLVIILAALAADLWRMDWLETHVPRKPLPTIWGRPPVPALAIGRHRR